MKVEDIPIKSDIRQQTDAQHELSAQEVNALVETACNANRDISSLRSTSLEHESRIKNSESKISSMQQGVYGFNTEVNDVNTAYKRIVQRVISIEASMGKNVNFVLGKTRLGDGVL